MISPQSPTMPPTSGSMIGNAQVPLESITLRNGMTVWLSEDHTLPKVYGSVVVHIGAKDSPNTGIAHYFEHIMFKGTDRIGTMDYAREKPLLDEIEQLYSQLSQAQSDQARHQLLIQINELSIQAAQYAIPNDFNNLIAKYGGTGLNAGTSYDYTVYHNSFAPEYITQWCMLNSERLLSPVFRLFQSELETVYEEKNMYADRPTTGMQQAIFEHLMAPHPYQYPIIGSTEALKSPDMQAMSDFFERYYTAGNMTLLLTGDIQRDGLEQLLETTFGRLRPGKNARPAVELPPPLSGTTRLDVKLPIKLVRGSGIVWRAYPAGDPTNLKLQIVQGMLSNAEKTGLLDTLVLRDQIQMAQAINFALNDLGFFGILILPKMPLQSNQSAQALVLKAVQQLQHGDYPQRLFESVKGSIYRQLLLMLEDPERRHDVLQEYITQGAAPTQVAQDLNILQQLTREEIQQTVAQVLNDDKVIITKKTGKYPVDKLPKPPFAPIRPEHVDAQSDYARALQEIPIQHYPLRSQDLSTVECRSLSDDGLVQLYMTPNSLNNLFSLQLIFYHGAYRDPRVHILEGYMDLTGTQELEAHAFNAEVQAIGTSIDYLAHNDYFKVTVKGFDAHFEESIRLLSQILLTPREDGTILRQLVQERQTYNESVKSNPSEISSRFAEHIRHGADAVYRSTPTLKELKKYKPTFVHTTMSELLGSEMDLHYCGTLSEETIREILHKYLPLDKGHQPFGGYTTLSAHSISQHRDIYMVDFPDTTQAIIRGYLRLPNLSAADQRIATFFATYFGGGMGSVLFREIREYRSLAYGVSCYADIMHPRSHGHSPCIHFVLSTQSDKCGEALDTLLHLLSAPPITTEYHSTATDAMRSLAYAQLPTMRDLTPRAAYLKRQGWSDDYAKYLLHASETTVEELTAFVSKYISHQSVALCIVSDRQRTQIHYPYTDVDIDDLLHL